jgi:hypothetical protein
VSFIISGPDLDPDKVSGWLAGLTPTHTHRRGDARKSPPGRDIVVQPYDSGMWMLRSSLPESAPLPDQLAQLLTQLEKFQADVKALSAEGRVYFNCEMWGPTGLELPADLLARMGALGADFGVTVYPDYGDQEA